MRKVEYRIDVRALGSHEGEFYVESDTSTDKIKQMVHDACDYYISYDVSEDEYEPIQVVEYRKKGQ